MTHKNRSLSANESAVRDVINRFPGLTPVEIAKHVSTIPASSISACTARLIWLRQVNRLKVPMSPTYRYYPKDAPLPNGVTQWNNALVKVRRTKKGNGESPTDAQLDLLLPLKQAPSDKVSLQGVSDVLITIPVGERESITISVEQARRIWMQLNAIFGRE